MTMKCKLSFTLVPSKLRICKSLIEPKLSKISQFLVGQIRNLLFSLNAYGPCSLYVKFHGSDESY